METTVTLVKDAGVTAVFIAFLIWLVKYFMSQIERWRDSTNAMQREHTELITNHLSAITETLQQMQNEIKFLAQQIEVTIKVLPHFRNPEEK